MSSLKDLVKGYMGTDPAEPHNYNCAESFMRSCNEYYDLGLDENALKLFCAFGGGMHQGLDCGFFVAAVSVLGLMYGSDEIPYTNPRLKSVIRRFGLEFSRRFKFKMCKDLRNTLGSCSDLGTYVANFFEEFIKIEEGAIT